MTTETWTIVHKNGTIGTFRWHNHIPPTYFLQEDGQLDTIKTFNEGNIKALERAGFTFPIRSSEVLSLTKQ